jgi:mono/diheme cytochrome c family protein
MFSRVRPLVFVVVALVLVIVALGTPAFAAGPTGDATRGQYLVHLNGGCGCHTDVFGHAIGGQTFAGPFGAVYSKNITPDQTTGIGKWTVDQIIAAIRTGKDDEGTQLFPAMPYPSFSGLADQDVADLVAYVRTWPAVKHDPPKDALKGPVPPFTAPAPAPKVAPTTGVDRGKYLVSAIAICSDCHTPMKPDGSPDMTKFLAGGLVPGASVAANITSDNDTGIGKRTAEQIAQELRTGRRPDGTLVEELMRQQIQGGYQNLTQADAMDIASFIKTVPAVKNTPQYCP